MNIQSKTIKHSEQKYETVGDYFKDGDNWQFRISDMKNTDYEFLVFIHEVIECYLTQKRGITEKSITEFDKEFEKVREYFPKIIGDQEPGHMVNAPYHKEHVFAEKIEKLVAEELGVDWNRYDKTVSEL